MTHTMTPSPCRLFLSYEPVKTAFDAANTYLQKHEQRQGVGATSRDLLALAFTLAVHHRTSVHVTVGVRASALAVRCFALARAHPRTKLCAGFFFVSHFDAMLL